jgi:hypothetical protein
VILTGSLSDGIVEWWTGPLATRLTGRTVGGAIASDGTIVAWQTTDNGATTRVPVAVASPDDHSCPALWAADGHRMVMVRSEHGSDVLLRVRVSDAAGTIESLAAYAEQTYDWGAGVSYAQVHHITHLSDATQDTFWVFARVTLSTWAMLPLSVDQATGAVTFGTPVTVLSATGQTYISTADAHSDGQQVIRVAWGYNPSAASHVVRYLEIDCPTGAITSPLDPDVASSIDGTGLPVVDTDVSPLLGEPLEGWSRRLFYVRPGPASPAVCYADWDETTPEAAIYRVTAFTGLGDQVTTTYGVAGVRLGYTAAANYIAGMSFPDPCEDDRVAVARVDVDGLSTVDVMEIGADGTTMLTTQITSDATNRLARPTWPRGSADLIVTEVTHYGATYSDFAANLMLYRAWTAPAITTDRAPRMICGELRTGKILSHRLPVAIGTWETVHRDSGSLTTMIPDSVLRDNPRLPSYLEGARCWLGAAIGDRILEAGPVWVHDYAPGALTVQARGLWSIWDYRMVMAALDSGWASWTVVHDDLSLATQAKRLVELAMTHTGGDLPVVLPPDESGTHERTLQGFELATVAEKIRALMDGLHGPDIAFDPRFADANHIEWLMRTGTTSDPMLHQDGSDWAWDARAVRSSVSGFTVHRDWSNLAATAWATGDGMDEALLVARAQDTSGLLAAGFPLMESVEAYPQVRYQSTLQNHVDGDQGARSRPVMTWGLTAQANGSPAVDQCHMGDYAMVWVPTDHPYLRGVLPGGVYRTRIVRMAGSLGPDVAVAFQPTLEAR